MRPTVRQEAALQGLLRRAGDLLEVDAVVLIGSLAAGTADAMSDVDAIAIVRDAAFAAAWSRRHALHAVTAPACWDHRTEPPSDIGAHKWIDESGVLVEVLLGTVSGPLRVAAPARVVWGDPAALARARRRPPIARAEMTDSKHPIEAAYDRLKAAVRQSTRH